MQLQTAIDCFPKSPPKKERTERGKKPRSVFQLDTPTYWVKLSVTGKKDLSPIEELPTEVATMLAAWSLSILAQRADLLSESKVR